MRLFVPVLALGLLAGVQEASAQFSAQKDAQYIATLKAVVNYKINDEENLKDIESLRQNQAFNQKLQRMLNKLQNTRTKTPLTVECSKFSKKPDRTSTACWINKALRQKC